MPAPLSPLPIDDALPALTAALRAGNSAVLVAPPGAGKTTRVPLALLGEPWVAGRKILVLEPRRLAARAAAERMAGTLGEAAGETVGYRARFGSKVGRRTRIEVITEGIFTRMIVDDPELAGIAAVLFDEFHERSLDADLGLALALEAQGALREDLRLLVMSATLDGARVARLLGDGRQGPAPVIESAGRAYPVENRYAGRDPRVPIERQMAEAVRRALGSEGGSVLAFLPGTAEIRRTERMLRETLHEPGIEIAPLYGALDPQAQDRAISPSTPGTRKVVLATSIAETSLTIEGVRIVIDSGLARVPRFEPGVGLTRLETVRVSRAAADQRRGRAGRTEPGVCWRLWNEAETASLPAFTTPEILAADLSRFMLDLGIWGVSDPAALALLDPAPEAAVAEAKALLRVLGALDAEGRVTSLGRAMAGLPLEPRLARMVIEGGRRGQAEQAARIAVLVSERGLGGDAPDLAHRLDDFARDRSRRAEEARTLAARWAREAGGRDEQEPLVPAALLALAFPDRIARGRGDGRRFVLANGRGAALDPASPLARARFLTVAELTGSAEEARILLAAELIEADIETLFGAEVSETTETVFDAAAGALRARRVRRLGALVLAERPAAVVPGPQSAAALARAAAARGIERLGWSYAQRQTLDRVRFLHAGAPERWPDLADARLAASVEDWLAPHLHGLTALSQIDAGVLGNALAGLLPWELGRRLESEAPTHVEVPTGSRLPIDYAAEGGPQLAVRVQELFGLNTHPTIADGRVPLTLALLSPAHRPIQLTRDLPAFWQGSWKDVRADMRGRYPRHPWPEDPATAEPTRRAKPRGQ